MVFHFGAWRSLVARLPWAQEVRGSNPRAPTNHINKLGILFRSWKLVYGWSLSLVSFSMSRFFPRVLIGWQTLAVNGQPAQAVLSSGIHARRARNRVPPAWRSPLGKSALFGMRDAVHRGLSQEPPFVFIHSLEVETNSSYPRVKEAHAEVVSFPCRRHDTMQYD